MEEDTNRMKALPRYQCHKQVRAAKIREMLRELPWSAVDPEACAAVLRFVYDAHALVIVSKAYLDKHQPQAGGYYVIYDDGYESYSPAGPFESGYTRIENEPQQDRLIGVDYAVGQRNITEKTLHNSDVSGAHKNVPDLKVVGNGDYFQLLFKASSQAEGWMKSTKAMEVPCGCIVQVTTQQRNPDGSYAVAEAVTYVPGAAIVGDKNGGRRLIQHTGF